MCGGVVTREPFRVTPRHACSLVTALMAIATTSRRHARRAAGLRFYLAFALDPKAALQASPSRRHRWATMVVC